MTRAPVTLADSTTGILAPAEGLRRFELVRRAPAPDLAPFVDWYWTIRWSLPAPFAQEVLPHPCVNLVFECGAAVVTGPGTARTRSELAGTGRVVAAKFKPGGFHPFSPVPLRALVDRRVDAAELFGADAVALQGELAVTDDDEVANARLEGFLRARLGPEEPALREVMALVARAQEDRVIARAEDLARAAGRSLRTLQRLFDRYVGVGPKWVVRRSRVQQAAERVAAGEKVSWSALAAELGYHDQAHFIRDFKAQIGTTPRDYAARCAPPGVGG